MRAFSIIISIFIYFCGISTTWAQAQPTTVSAASFFNEGTLAWAKGDKGRAVWNYFKALDLSPTNHSLQNNLHVIEKEFGYPLEHSRLKIVRNLFFTQRFLNTTQNISLLAVIWALFWFAVFRYLFKKTRFLKKTIWVLAVVILYLSVSLVTNIWIHQILERGIVLTEELGLHTNFLDISQATENLGAGMEVLILDKHVLPDDTEWMFIDRNGKKGWVLAAEITPI